MKLTDAASVVVRKGNREVSAWRFTVEPDRPPSIALVGQPKVAESGALHLTYSLEDDYGVVAALGEIAPVGDTAGAAGARPLYEAPALPLSLPQLRTRKGNGDTTRDLTSHPWAGAKVKLTLVARDEAGQEGRSAPVELTLPARVFTNKLARAVVEQRGRLALDANAADSVADALDALTMAPEKTIAKATDYLMLRSAYHRLVDARSDDELRGVVDYLWTIALGTRGRRPVARRPATARCAGRAPRGAGEQRLRRGDRQAHAATPRRHAEIHAGARRSGAAEPADGQPAARTPTSQTLRPQDLERMLDQIENLAKTGARDAARQLLSQLQNMLENLQAGQPQQGDPGQQQAMKNLDQLGDMIRKQEDLMNKTFRAQRGQSQQGQAMTEEELQQALKDLQVRPAGAERRPRTS